MKEPKWDVAISFLSSDLQLARDLSARLSESLKCFLYERQQEDLAGRDAMEAFAVVFRDQSRLNVVLHRDGWGDTDMTAIEAAAIQDSALRTRFETLFLVKLVNDDKPPPWVPKRHIYYGLPDFGFEGLVGAVKSRVLELGGRFHRLSITELAAQKVSRADDEMRRDAVKNSSNGLRQVEANVKALIDEAGSNLANIKELVGTVPAAFKGDTSQWGCTVRLSRFVLSLYWENQYLGTAKKGTLTAIIFEGASQHLGYQAASGSQIERKTKHYSAKLAVGDQWVWLDDNSEEEWTNSGLLDSWLRELLDLAFPDDAADKTAPTMTFLNFAKRR